MPSSTRRFWARALSERARHQGQGLPVALDAQDALRQAGLREVVAHGLRPPLGELLVVGVRAHVVRVAVDRDRVVLRGEEDSRDAAQQLLVLRPEVGLVELELQVVPAQVHHQAQGGAPRLGDLAQGFLEAAHLRFRPLADPLRLGLHGRGGFLGGGGLLARGVRLLARRRRFRLGRLACLRGGPGLGFRRGGAWLACAASAAASSAFTDRAATARSTPPMR